MTFDPPELKKKSNNKETCADDVHEQPHRIEHILSEISRKKPRVHADLSEIPKQWNITITGRESVLRITAAARDTIAVQVREDQARALKEVSAAETHQKETLAKLADHCTDRIAQDGIGSGAGSITKQHSRRTAPPQ
ncbi:MAG: hypothetical protein H7245_24085 [Candidatus Saccharibacteria bacterium]|nr:hypothetical protein [Pseudorhodobacter sp.]